MTISRETGERVVRRVAGSFAVLEGMRVEPIAHRIVRQTTGGLFSVRLSIRMPHVAASLEHEAILKVLRSEAPALEPHLAKFAPSSVPDHPNYWLREFLAYDVASVVDLPAPLRLPACYERDRDETTATVWLEAVPSESPATWGDARFASVAYALGVWQGAAAKRLRREPPPTWFARGSLAMWSPGPGGSADAAAHDDDHVTRRAATAAFGPEATERMRAIWRGRGRALAALERLPRSIAHGDCWTRNLLARSDPGADVVAIDWSELGVAPLAHDLVNLVLDSVWMLDVPEDRLGAIEAAVLDAYTNGWNASGERASRDDVEFAYRTSAALRFETLAGVLLRQAAREPKRVALAQRYGRDFDEIFAARATVIRAALAVKS